MNRLLPGLAVLLLAAPLYAADEKPAVKVPYRLSESHHIVVRAKLNGKGPYNFILDTGAPFLYVATGVSKKLGVEPDKAGWGTFDRVELEGGVVLEKTRAQIADPYQLKGMNAMGLAGADLHGIIGYSVIARYRITLDLTDDKMVWVPLQYDPPVPEPLSKKEGAEGVEAMGALAEMAAKMIGQRGSKEIKPRGFLGIELAEKDNAVTVQAVIAKGPAAEGGVQAGDRIVRFAGQQVRSAADVHRHAAKLAEGDSVAIVVLRGGEEKDITLKLGKGL